MATEKFIMVSLEDEKAKELANVISNDTSRKILEFLSEHDAAESDIAKKLKLPASTVHYNIQHLLKHHMIEIKDFYWSEKGNKVKVYSVAKKLIVIAPKSMKIKTKLRSILPVALLSLAASGMIHIYSKYFSKATHSFAVGGSRADFAGGLAEVSKESADLGGSKAAESAPEALSGSTADASSQAADTITQNTSDAVSEAVRAGSDRVIESVPQALDAAPTVIEVTPPNYALWFLIGSFFAILIYTLITTLLKRKK